MLSTVLAQVPQASTLQLWGAGAFGAIIGWYVYYVNRYRKADVQLSDLVSVVGVLGGGAILAIFPARTDLFGAYGIGLFAGFFGYLFVLAILVAASKNFDRDYFLDGRRKRLPDHYYIPAELQQPVRPLAVPGEVSIQIQARGTAESSSQPAGSSRPARQRTRGP